MTIQLPTLHWQESPNQGARQHVPIDLVVIHDCEGGDSSARATFMNPASQVSAHFVLNESGSVATQMVRLSRNAWHARIFNSRSHGIEMAGFAARGFGVVEWTEAAHMIAQLLHQIGQKPIWAHGGHGGGFCSHYELGVPGGHHFDPTTDPKIRDSFVQRVQSAYAAGGFLPSWGRP